MKMNTENIRIKSLYIFIGIAVYMLVLVFSAFFIENENTRQLVFELAMNYPCIILLGASGLTMLLLCKR